MKHSIIVAAALFTAVLASTAAAAGAGEAASSVVDKATAVERKTANAVKRGVDKAASGIQYGGKKSSEAVHRTAKKVGVPTTPASATPPPQTSK